MDLGLTLSIVFYLNDKHGFNGQTTWSFSVVLIEFLYITMSYEKNQFIEGGF